MKRSAFTLLFAVIFLILVTTTLATETKIIDQRIGRCDNGEEITGEIETGEKVEVEISILITEEKEIMLFSQLLDSEFYLEEDQVSKNSSMKLTLQPGTYTIRVIGSTPLGADQQEITLLGSYNLGRYVTAKISSPYILKNSAYSYIILSGLSCIIGTVLLIFFFTKGKFHRMKSKIMKKSEESRTKDRDKMIVFLKGIASNLNANQRREAKKLLKEFDGG